MKEKEIKEKFIELFEKVLKEKDLKKREKILLEIRNFAIKVEEEKKTTDFEFKSETLHENLEEFLNLPSYENELLQNCVKKWIWKLKNE